ncbi:MAG: hypothetical protein WBQ21_09675 [Solirubrobacteraceae bacterium]
MGTIIVCVMLQLFQVAGRVPPKQVGCVPWMRAGVAERAEPMDGAIGGGERGDG